MMSFINGNRPRLSGGRGLRECLIFIRGMGGIKCIGLFAGIAAMLCNAHAGVEQAGIGPKAVETFGLERPNTDTKDTETAKLSFQNLKNPLAGVALPADLLKAGGDGRVNLFSVSRLTEQDLQNPFEVRVQVAVDVLETVLEIGGIIEGDTPQRNTVIILTRPPKVRSAADSQKAGKDDKEKPIVGVYAVGDVVEGFRIRAIGRDSIIVEQSEKYVEVARGRPVTVCVPLSVF